jgi:predicted RNase H-like HicB family nuclease
MGFFKIPPLLVSAADRPLMLLIAGLCGPPKCRPSPPFKEVGMELSAILTPAPEGGYVAFNPETGTTTQGESVEEALANLREATELYLEEFPLSISGRPLLTTFQIPAHA